MAKDLQETSPPAEAEQTKHPRHTTRRTFVRTVVAATAGVVAAGYVKPSMQSLGVSSVSAQFYGPTFGTPPPPPPPSGGNCTPGYWKTHPSVWTSTSPYNTNTLLTSVFIIPAGSSGQGCLTDSGTIGTDNLLQALSYPDPPLSTACKKLQNLLKHATAGLLNVQRGGFGATCLNASYNSFQEIIDAVNAAIGLGNGAMETLAQTLDNSNNACETC